MRTILLILLVALAPAGCTKGAAMTAPVPAPVPPEPGTTAPPTAPPATSTCVSDDDCVITCARPNECCPQLCEPCGQAMHRDELAAHEAWRARSCSADRCPVARCVPPKDRTAARCQSGACVVERLPL